MRLQIDRRAEGFIRAGGFYQHGEAGPGTLPCRSLDLPDIYEVVLRTVPIADILRWLASDCPINPPTCVSFTDVAAFARGFEYDHPDLVEAVSYYRQVVQKHQVGVGGYVLIGSGPALVYGWVDNDGVDFGSTMFSGEVLAAAKVNVFFVESRHSYT